MTTMQVNGAALAVFRQGAGAPVVFVHGSSSDYRTWEGTAAAVGKHHESINYSRRYHRPNEPIAKGADYAMAEQADDLEALIEGLNAGPVHLVAHSYGGVLALIVAPRRPELIASIVLEEPAAFNLLAHDPPKPLELLRLFVRSPRLASAFMKFGIGTVEPAKRAMKRGDFETANRIFAEGVLGPEAFAALSAERAKQAEENSFPEELLGSGFLHLDSEVVRALDRPALVISGEQSPVLWSLIADEVASVLPDAKRIRVPRASHIVHEDNPIAFEAALLDFIDSVSSARR